MQYHEIDYTIHGDDLQFIEVELDPEETVIAEAGAMCWMEDGISFEAKMGDGSTVNQTVFSKLLSAGKRVLSRESLFITHFTNSSSKKRKLAFSAPYPGTIIPLPMKELGGLFYCQKDAFLCAAMGTQLDIMLQKKLGVGFFGGEGFILESIKSEGNVFIYAGGTVVKRHLQNETIYVDTGCVVGFTSEIDFSIEMPRGLKTILFSGEGLFLAKLSGLGTVYLQSMPFSRLANRVIASASLAGGVKKGEGSLLGTIGNILDGGR